MSKKNTGSFRDFIKDLLDDPVVRMARRRRGVNAKSSRVDKRDYLVDSLSGLFIYEYDNVRSNSKVKLTKRKRKQEIW